jgi:hypothetical protein
MPGASNPGTGFNQPFHALGNPSPHRSLALYCVYCDSSDCDSSNYRISKLRPSDIFRLILLQYPVRCRNCDARKYLGILQAYRIHCSRKFRHRERHP